MKYLPDGTPISTNITSLNDKDYLSKFKCNEIHIGIIWEIYYTDDDKNINKKDIEYKVKIESGNRMGQFFENVVAMNLFGGLTNFSETVYQPKENLIQTKGGNDRSVKKSKERDSITVSKFDSDASTVIVAFLDGYNEQPIIIGSYNHRSREDYLTKKEDGIRHIQEFNGMRLEINDDGEYTLTYLGGKRNSKTKKSARPNTAPSLFKIDKDGHIILEQREVVEVYGEPLEDGEIINQIKMDRSAPSITHQIGKNFFIISDEEGKESVILLRGGSMIQIDELSNIKCMTKKGNTLYLNNEKDEVLLSQSQGNNIGMTEDEITVSHKSGDSIITMDADNVQVTSKGSVIFQSGALDLNMGTLNLTGQQEVNIKDSVGGKLHIKNGQVALGNSAAELLDIVDQLITAVSTHVHIGNLGYATAPPIDQATLTAIKALLALIKGTL